MTLGKIYQLIIAIPFLLCGLMAAFSLLGAVTTESIELELTFLRWFLLSAVLGWLFVVVGATNKDGTPSQN